MRDTTIALVNSLASVSLSANDNTALAHQVLKSVALRAHSTLESTAVVALSKWAVLVVGNPQRLFDGLDDAMTFARGKVYVDSDTFEACRIKLASGCSAGWVYGFSEVHITPPEPTESIALLRDGVVSAALDWDNEAGTKTRAALLRAVRNLKGGAK